MRLANDGKQLTKHLVSDRDLAVVGSNDDGRVVESVAEERSHLDHVLLPNHLDDAVVLHGLVAHLRCLERELFDVPPLEGLRQHECGLAHQYM